ncbi:unnamed protein product [Microthlaspi erraticum]|uniref:Uncharacterized protein n=1 Tax=Microthlaspi erraticum TaxID=1685480 RepID=A0A6D2HFJ4_9BRAS|nr:unnamed protein product [Microthlaspi erraticum]
MEFEFDTQVFSNIKSGRAVLASDSVLYDAMKTIIDGYLGNSSAFAADFTQWCTESLEALKRDVSTMGEVDDEVKRSIKRAKQGAIKILEGGHIGLTAISPEE